VIDFEAFLWIGSFINLPPVPVAENYPYKIQVLSLTPVTLLPSKFYRA